MPESRYRIIERIAAGGMAEVFRGVAESLQGFRKNVAVKRILPSLTKNKKFIAMFLDEARLSLSLQHTNVVQVFDIGHVDDTYFIVMEFVDGVDLKAILEWRRRINKPLTVGQTVYVIMEICKGLNYAHELPHPETGKPLGIVHRDVSPPNVLLSKNGEVKLTDFGLAKAAVQVEHTDPGVVKGKMSYLSPEAARGEEVDQRADIFAVGILLYEMLTNRRLFYGQSDYQTVELVRAARIPPIGAQNPEVEPELEDIVRKSLARRLEDRFQSGADLQDALAHYLFSRGLKMIQRDIAEMVRRCMEDQMTLSGAAKPARGNLVDAVLQEQIRAFTSMDFEEQDPAASTGMPGMSGDIVDPRAWANDTDWPWRKTGNRRSTQGQGVPEVQEIRKSQSSLAVPSIPAHAMSPAPSERRSASFAAAPVSGPMPVPQHPAQVAQMEPVPLPPRQSGKGVVIGVFVGFLLLGVTIAAVVFRGG